MSAPPLVIANLGAEETASWRKLLSQPAAVTAARLFALLFAADAVIEPEAARAARPSGIPAADSPAFAWLDAVSAIAWLPSEEAFALARRAGRELDAPAPEVVAAVHEKAFALEAARAAGLEPRVLRDLCRSFDPQELRDADRCLDEIRAALADWPDWTRGRFALKPRLSTSGRGRVPGERDAFDEATLRGALPRLADRGGALLEPWLDRSGDYSAQFHVARDGELRLLGTLEQIVSTAGLYEGHRGVVDWRGRVRANTKYDEALVEAGATLARAAADRGFFGPCGSDAFAFRIDGEDGMREVLRPVCEFNARFTLGTIAIGLVRRWLPGLGLSPGDTRAFEFVIDGQSRSLPEGMRAIELSRNGTAPGAQLRFAS